MSDLRTVSRLVADCRYQLAIERLKERPNEALGKDNSGNTPLRRICRLEHPDDDAVAIAQVLAELNPELIVQGNEKPNKKTLLHEAVCRSRSGAPRSTELALVLIRADPACVSARDHPWKFTPFHTACEADADIVVLRAMLEVDPSLAAALTENSKTPMDILLRRNGWALTGPALDKVALILLTNFKQRVIDPPPMQYMVHAVCSYPRPLTFLTRIIKMFPDQTNQPDDEGMLPLHYAVKCVGTWDNSEDPFVHSNFVFQKLMKLVKTAPEALWSLDPVDGLYPVLMAATRADNSTINLSVTYQLLLAAPSMISQAVVVPEQVYHDHAMEE